MSGNVALGMLGLLLFALLVGYADSGSGTNDYGDKFGSAVGGIAALATVLAIAAGSIVAIRHIKSLIEK